MYHYRVAYGKNKIEGIKADDVCDAFAKTGNRADAAKLLGIKYKTLCSWLTSKHSFHQAMLKGKAEYRKHQN